MIEFNLYASPNFRGGTYYTSFSADNFFDLKDSLKYYWKKIGFSNETGEIFLFAKISISAVVKELPCGYFVFDKDGDLVAMLEDDEDEDINNYWSSLGFVSGSFSDPEANFEEKINLLFNVI